MGAGLGERPLFRLGQCGHAGIVQTGGIFAARPEHEAEEGIGNFVMLRVRRIRVLGDRALDHVPRKIGGGMVGRIGEGDARAPNEQFDRAARDEIGDGQSVVGAIGERGQDHPRELRDGGRGKKALTRRW